MLPIHVRKLFQVNTEGRLRGKRWFPQYAAGCTRFEEIKDVARVAGGRAVPDFAHRTIVLASHPHQDPHLLFNTSVRALG